MSLLFGAESNAEMERGRQLQAGIEAEETIHLPPRDTKKTSSAAADCANSTATPVRTSSNRPQH